MYRSINRKIADRLARAAEIIGASRYRVVFEDGEVFGTADPLLAVGEAAGAEFARILLAAGEDGPAAAGVLLVFDGGTDPLDCVADYSPSIAAAFAE